MKSFFRLIFWELIFKKPDFEFPKVSDLESPWLPFPFFKIYISEFSRFQPETPRSRVFSSVNRETNATQPKRSSLCSPRNAELKQCEF